MGCNSVYVNVLKRVTSIERKQIACAYFHAYFVYHERCRVALLVEM